jgi:RNA recognition motif-containing protein
MRLYIGNLASNTTEQALRNAFATHGTVNDCRIPTDRATGIFKGFGVVEMAQNDQANKAIAALNSTQLDGKTIEVRESTPKDDVASAAASKPAANGTAKTQTSVTKATAYTPAQPKSDKSKTTVTPPASPTAAKNKTAEAKAKN